MVGFSSILSGLAYFNPHARSYNLYGIPVLSLYFEDPLAYQVKSTHFMTILGIWLIPHINPAFLIDNQASQAPFVQD